MQNPIEHQFARLHFDFGLTARDLASVYLIPLKEAERLLERAKVFEERFLRRLVDALFEPQGSGHETLSDS